MRRFVFALLAATTICASAIAHLPSTAAAQGASTGVRIDFVRDSLPNGLKVLYHVDRSAPVVAVDIWYDVGSRHEQPGRTGFAHLFEHMMFKGSRNVADGQHFALLETAGGRAGADINGTTWYDRTNYFEQVPSNQLELALWLEADRMGTLLETLTSEKLENQREVVKNERRQGVDNQPYGTWLEKMTSHAFPRGHPFYHPVIGFMTDLDAATLQDVRDFFRRYYSPDNAVLVVAGDIDLDRARALVRKHFSDIPRGPQRPPNRSAQVPLRLTAAAREVVEDANARAPAVYMGFRVPPARDARSPAVELLGTILGSGRSSHLYSTLIRQQQIAATVTAFNLGFLDGADLLILIARGKPGSNADSLERALDAAVATALTAVTPEQLARVRAAARYGFVNALQTMGGFGGRADRLAEGQTYYNNPNWVNTRLAAYERVTLAELRTLASSFLDPRNRVTLVYVPRPAPSTPRTQ